ncbi:MAG: OmpA family protein [Archangium sp.]|nr:OmpA family protein [Archangium sp.]
MLRPLLLLTIVSSVALAQNDDWNTFPPAPKPADPPKTEPAKATPPPANTPPPAPTSKPADPPPASKPPPRLQAALNEMNGVDAGVSDDGTTIVSKKERFEAGTEPHSPSTWGNAWDAKENSRVTVGQVGVGNLWVPSARLGGKGVVRVSLMGEYMNQQNFPVLQSQNIRSAVTFAASFQPFDWGEIFVSYGAAANTNNRTSPNLIQALGDLSLGIKASREWAKGLHAGADLRLLTFSGVGNQGIDRFAVGFRPTLLGTFDFRTLTKYVPLLFTLALGFTLDSTSGLVTNQRLNASEEYALNVNRYHRFNFGIGAELPFPIVTPTIEYSLAAPLGVANGELTGPDGKFINAGAAMNQQLGLGLKITAIKDLTLTTGFNFGLARSVGLGVPATPPWNFFIGAGFAIDPFQRGETRFVETIRERKMEVAKAPAATRVEGVVTDASSGAALSGVIVSLSGIKPAATDETGRYESLPITAKSVKVTVARDGFKAVEREVTVDATKPTKLDLALEPDVKKAKFEVSATGNKKPVKADIAFSGASAAKLQTLEAPAPAEIELPAGTYTITAAAEGWLAQTRDVQVQAGGKLVVAFDLQPAPKKVLVIFKGDKIEILQQVRFATGKSTILPESFGLLQQVVDAIVKNNVRRVRVEGHTDNRGVKAQNQTLSEDRARSVKEYLVAQGIDAERLESVGYGDSKPIAPNLTARGRELNRRVEFIVLDK